MNGELQKILLVPYKRKHGVNGVELDFDGYITKNCVVCGDTCQDHRGFLGTINGINCWVNDMATIFYAGKNQPQLVPIILEGLQETGFMR